MGLPPKTLKVIGSILSLHELLVILGRPPQMKVQADMEKASLYIFGRILRAHPVTTMT